MHQRSASSRRRCSGWSRSDATSSPDAAPSPQSSGWRPGSG